MGGNQNLIFVTESDKRCLKTHFMVFKILVSCDLALSRLHIDAHIRHSCPKL